MKRPVLGTFAILALLGAGIYFALWYKETAQAPETPSPCYEGAAARQRFREQFDISLPNSATAIHYCLESLETTQLVFASFDLPNVEMIDLFERQDRLPTYESLKSDSNLVAAMSALASPRRDWWRIDDKLKPRAAQRSGNRVLPSSTVKWRAQVCAVPLSPDASRVFVAFSEEPQSAP